MSNSPQLIQFLQQELAVSPTEIDALMHHRDHQDAPLPMLLWLQGLLSLAQLIQVFDWLETHYDCSPILLSSSTPLNAH